MTAHGQDGSIAFLIRDGGRLVEFMLQSPPLWPELGRGGWHPPPVAMPTPRRRSHVTVRAVGPIRRAR